MSRRGAPLTTAASVHLACQSRADDGHGAGGGDASRGANGGAPDSGGLDVVNLGNMRDDEQGGTAVVSRWVGSTRRRSGRARPGAGAAGCAIFVPAAPLSEVGGGRAWWHLDAKDRPQHAWDEQGDAGYQPHHQVPRFDRQSKRCSVPFVRDSHPRDWSSVDLARRDVVARRCPRRLACGRSRGGNVRCHAGRFVAGLRARVCPDQRCSSRTGVKIRCCRSWPRRKPRGCSSDTGSVSSGTPSRGGTRSGERRERAARVRLRLSREKQALPCVTDSAKRAGNNEEGSVRGSAFSCSDPRPPCPNSPFPPPLPP